MSSNVLLSRAATIFQVLSLHKVLYLIAKEKLDQLTPELRGFTSFATDELIDAVGMPIPRARGQVYLFTSERTFFRGNLELKEEERFAGSDFACITSSPGLLFKRIVKLNPVAIHIDYGNAAATSIEKSEIESLERIMLVSKLSQLKVVYVLTDKKKFAVEMMLEDKPHAIVFLTKEDAAATLAAETDGCRIDENEVGTLARGLLSSHLMGVIVNPGKPEQFTLARDDLELLSIASESQVKKFSLTDFVRQLFSMSA